MRLTFALVLVLASCSRIPDETAAVAQPLAGPLAARLTGLRRLVQGGALSPQLSPDGRFVAFSGPRYHGLRVVSASGGEPVTLSDAAGAGFRFAWSPDGSSIAFVTREEDRSSLLRVVDRSGGTPRTIHRALPGDPLPLPRFTDSGALVFVDRDQLGIDGRPEPVARALPSPRLVMPVSGELLVAGDRGIFATDADGAHARPLFEGKAFFEFTAAPNGSILVARELREGGANLWALDRATGQRTLLPGYDRGCVLSSGLVVAEHLEGDGLQLTRGELWLMRPDGTGAVRLDGAAGAVHYRVDCAERAERLAFGDDASDSIYVADVEVSR